MVLLFNPLTHQPPSPMPKFKPADIGTEIYYCGIDSPFITSGEKVKLVDLTNVKHSPQQHCMINSSTMPVNIQIPEKYFTKHPKKPKKSIFRQDGTIKTKSNKKYVILGWLEVDAPFDDNQIVAYADTIEEVDSVIDTYGPLGQSKFGRMAYFPNYNYSVVHEKI